MKKIIPALFIFVISACGASYPPTPLPTATPASQESTVDLAATMLYDQLAANATKQTVQQEELKREAAVSATAISIQTTATYQAEMALRATQGAREIATAKAAAQFSTATQQAFIIEATASKDAWNAQATATERSVGWTATADAVDHALEVEAKITQQAADAIRLEGESQQIALAVERQQIKNKADAILPWSLVIAALIIAGAWIYSASKYKEAPRNPDGTYNLPLFRSGKGWTIIRPELLPVGATAIDDADGTVHYQGYEDAEEQAETTRRAQAIEALRALPPGREKQAMQITAGAFSEEAQTANAEIEILPPDSSLELGPVLDELEGQVIDEREMKQ